MQLETSRLSATARPFIQSRPALRRPVCRHRRSSLAAARPARRLRHRVGRRRVAARRLPLQRPRHARAAAAAAVTDTTAAVLCLSKSVCTVYPSSGCVLLAKVRCISSNLNPRLRLYYLSTSSDPDRIFNFFLFFPSLFFSQIKDVSRPISDVPYGSTACKMALFIPRKSQTSAL